jgi:hypothetical protein
LSVDLDAHQHHPVVHRVRCPATSNRGWMGRLALPLCDRVSLPPLPPHSLLRPFRVLALTLASVPWLSRGALTASIGILAGFYLPPSPTQTAGRFRGRAGECSSDLLIFVHCPPSLIGRRRASTGWFTPREEIIMVNRVLRDDPSKGKHTAHCTLHTAPSAFLLYQSCISRVDTE